MVMNRVLTSLGLLAIVAISYVLGTNSDWKKYNRDMNRVDGRQEMDPAKLAGQEFRSRRVTQVWQKAIRNGMSKDKLKDLHKELERNDLMYHKLKKEASRKDSSNDIQDRSEAEIMVERQLRETMEKFGLASRVGKKQPLAEDLPFTDPKVTHLWIKAQKSKLFSEEELSELKEELSGHQAKLDQFNELLDEIHGPDGSKANSPKRFSGKNQDEIHSIRTKEMELKLKHRELSREFQRIASKTVPEEERGPFTDNRVITLWQEAQGQNFTAEDLDMILEELKSFEGKLLKHEDAQRAALQAELDYRATAKDPSNNGVNSEPKSLHVKAKELGQNVHQTMKDLRQRISQGGRWREEL